MTLSLIKTDWIRRVTSNFTRPSLRLNPTWCTTGNSYLVLGHRNYWRGLIMSAFYAQGTPDPTAHLWLVDCFISGILMMYDTDSRVSFTKRCRSKFPSCRTMLWWVASADALANLHLSPRDASYRFVKVRLCFFKSFVLSKIIYGHARQREIA